MHYSTILALAGTALAMPAAEPRPAPTPVASPMPAPVAAPEPTAAPEPQFGLGLTTPLGGFNIGSNPKAAPPPPPPKDGNGKPCAAYAAYCIYNSISGSVYSSISGGVQDGVLDAFGLKPSPTPAPVPYYPDGSPGWNPQPQQAPYPQQGAPYPQQGAPYPQQGAPYPQQGSPYPPQQGAPYPPQQGGLGELTGQLNSPYGGQQGYQQQNSGWKG